LVDITQFNTFGLAVYAGALVQLHTVAHVQTFIAQNRAQILAGQVRVIGGGSNMLFTQDFAGTLVQLALTEITEEPLGNRYVSVYAGAGVVWHDLVTYTVQRGLGGLENLALIWGWVGAAPMQNIGAYGAEVRDTITHVHTLEVATGQERIFTNEQCQFGYRASVFKHELAGQYWITGVRFKLDTSPALKMGYGDIQKTLAEWQLSQPTLADVARAVAAIRTAKLPNPHQVGNAGSFFKNPEVPQELAHALLAQHPLMPYYPQVGGLVKIPAGWLIEQAGWKGYRRGAVGVHPKQALVLVHYGGGTGGQVWQLAQDIAADVQVKFGILLTPEVNVV